MGQKVNPVGLRLGINRGWDSIWFAKKREYGKFLIEDFNIRKYIKKNVVNSGVSKVMIERTSKIYKFQLNRMTETLNKHSKRKNKCEQCKGFENYSL